MGPIGRSPSQHERINSVLQRGSFDRIEDVLAPRVVEELAVGIEIRVEVYFFDDFVVHLTIPNGRKDALECGRFDLDHSAVSSFGYGHARLPVRVLHNFTTTNIGGTCKAKSAGYSTVWLARRIRRK